MVGGNSCLVCTSRFAATQTVPLVAVQVVAQVHQSFDIVKDLVDKKAFRVKL